MLLSYYEVIILKTDKLGDLISPLILKMLHYVSLTNSY